MIKRDFYTLDDLFIIDNFIYTYLVVFRNGFFEDFPDWYRQVPYGDWALHVICAQYGLIGHIDQVMGIYRVHTGGTWANLDLVQRLIISMETQRFVAAELGRDTWLSFMPGVVSSVILLKRLYLFLNYLD